MKKSEIIQFLSERKCRVSSYYRNGNSLNVHLKYLSGIDLRVLDKKGYITFVEAKEGMLLLEITGYIEWD